MRFTEAAVIANRLEEIIDGSAGKLYYDGSGLIIPHSDSDVLLFEYESFIRKADMDEEYRQTLSQYLETFRMLRTCWKIKK